MAVAEYEPGGSVTVAWPFAVVVTCLPPTVTAAPATGSPASRTETVTVVFVARELREQVRVEEAARVGEQVDGAGRALALQVGQPGAGRSAQLLHRLEGARGPVGAGDEEAVGRVAPGDPEAPLGAGADGRARERAPAERLRAAPVAVQVGRLAVGVGEVDAGRADPAAQPVVPVVRDGGERQH